MASSSEISQKSKDEFPEDDEFQQALRRARALKSIINFEEKYALYGLKHQAIEGDPGEEPIIDSCIPRKASLEYLQWKSWNKHRGWPVDRVKKELVSLVNRLMIKYDVGYKAKVDSHIDSD